MTRSRALLFLVVSSTVPLMLLGCPSKPVADAGPAPTPTPTPTPSETVLAPLVEDSGADEAGDADAAKPKYTGPVLNTNQVRAKQCCSALRNQAKSLGSSPEAAQLTQYATLCDSLAMQVGPTSTGQAPELAPLRTMLQGKTIPPVCQGL
jgi:hypothetical protein